MRVYCVFVPDNAFNGHIYFTRYKLAAIYTKEEYAVGHIEKINAILELEEDDDDEAYYISKPLKGDVLAFAMLAVTKKLRNKKRKNK